MERHPILLVMAGPNGSGKSTITHRYSPVGEYVNADLIQQHLQCTPLEAAQTAEATREYLLRCNSDFTIETVLSTERNYLLMERAKAQGYTVRCIYVLTADPAVNIDRVRKRIAGGGNVAPLEKVAPRYCRSLKLLPRLFECCAEVYIFDNTPDRTKGTPSLIVQFRHGNMEIFPNDVWTEEMLAFLIQGRYAERFEMA